MGEDVCARLSFAAVCGVLIARLHPHALRQRRAARSIYPFQAIRPRDKAVNLSAAKINVALTAPESCYTPRAIVQSLVG
jgi:hypothetical protein